MAKSSTMQGHLDILKNAIENALDPGRDIWWSRAVLCKVIMTLGYSLGQADIQSDVALVEESGGQVQDYIRSS